MSATHVHGRTFITFPDAFDDLPDRSASLAKVLRRRKRAHRTSYVIRNDRADDNEPLLEVGALSAFDTSAHGLKPPAKARIARLAIEDDQPLGPGVGLAVLMPTVQGERCFRVMVKEGAQERLLGRACAQETPGPGVFVRQAKETPRRFRKQRGVTVERWVRWEGPPHSNQLRLCHYLVAIPSSAPPQQRQPGVFLHAWGGDMSRGYGTWHGIESGAVLLSINQEPYDWYTAYHADYGIGGPLRAGRVEPYTLRRVLAFVDWAAKRYDLDLTQLFVAGSSMGGTGASMFATHAPERFAWIRSNVGVHVPRNNKAFFRSFRRIWGAPGPEIKTLEGVSPWSFYDNASRVRTHPELNLPLFVFANGVNDENVAFAQAVEMLEALQASRQPHVFTWGSRGHSQTATFMGGSRKTPPVRLRTQESLPAFSRCSLDSPLRRRGRWTTRGQVNGWTLWGDVSETATTWSTKIWLAERAPQKHATVDVTPRRTRVFRPPPQTSVRFDVLEGEKLVMTGTATVDGHGLVTLPKVQISRRKRFLRLTTVNSEGALPQ